MKRDGEAALLAKAYSIVRGCGEKKDAPLDDFFAICAPLIGIIPPESYLQAMGWQLSPPQDGDQVCSFLHRVRCNNYNNN